MKQFLSSSLRPYLILAVVAFVLYLPGFWWGAPHATAYDRKDAWGVDDATPLGPLAEVHNIIAPKSDRNLGYPLMHPFIVSTAYTPYLGYLWLRGNFHAISPTYPFGLADPAGTLRNLTLIAHFISVLMGVGIVLSAYDAGRMLWDQNTGIVAALFAMLSFPMFYYSRTGNVDVPVLFFTALAVAVFARIIKGGFTVSRAVSIGAFVGFALATKEPSAASFLGLPFVLLAIHGRHNKGTARWLSWEFWKAPVAALLVTFFAFGIGSGLFVDHERYFAHVVFVTKVVDAATSGGIAFVKTHPFTWEGHRQLARLIGAYLIDAMTLPGLLLALVGVAWSLRKNLISAVFALPAITYLLVLFWSVRIAQLRYIMPVVFTLIFFSARAVTLSWNSRHMLVRAGFCGVAFCIIALSLLRGVDLTYAMIKDSRYVAASWLATRTKSGDRVAFFGDSANLPALKYGVSSERAIAYLGARYRQDTDQKVVDEIVERWREQKPQFIILMPDLSSPPNVPHNASCPDEVYQRLLDGTLGYRLGAYIETPTLLPWVRRPALDYPSVNPPIRIFSRATQSGALEQISSAK